MIGLTRWSKPSPTKSRNSTASFKTSSTRRALPQAASTRTSNGPIPGTSSMRPSGKEPGGWSAHKIETEFAEDLPLINVDSGLIEESCGQLLENAAKYSPSGSTISVAAKAEQGHVILSISDQGVGITPDEQQYLGRRSFRSQRHQATIPGSGLGFWIASTFVGANGGTIGISSRWAGIGNHGLHHAARLRHEALRIDGPDQ